MTLLPHDAGENDGPQRPRSGPRLLPLFLLTSSLALSCRVDVGGSSGPGAGLSQDSGAPGGEGGAPPTESNPSTGAVGNSTEDMPPVGPVSFSCEPTLAGQSPPLRRLTRVQYESTLRDLLTLTLKGDAADAVLLGLRDELARLDDDTRIKVPEDLHGTYRRLDQAVQQSHVDEWFAVAQKAGALLSGPDYLSALLGACAESSPNDADADACIRGFVARFGALTLRRPPTSEEVDHYVSFYAPSTGIDPAGVSDIVTGLLSAPQFLYLIEHGAAPVTDSSDTFELSAHELAARLSYHFWNSMPDAQLMALADSAELLSPDTYLGEVERLWSDARTHDTISQFFLEWLKLEDLPELDRNNDANVFKNFAGENLPSPDLRPAMVSEAVDLMNYYTWQSPAGLAEVFLTPYSFARTTELADLYGVEPWNGSGTPPELEGRPGLLTRAAFLSTGTANTRPIMKGVFIRMNVLCDVIPPPPANAGVIPPDLDPDLTTREVVEALTEGKDNLSCAGCHQTYINALGFATEGFDSLGRARSEQMLFAADGELTGTKPIDTSVMPQILLGDETVVQGPEELMGEIAASGKLEACFVRHYFRFSFGRFEQVGTDGCVLEQMRTALAESGSIADMLRTVALSDAFKRRTFNPSDGSSVTKN